MSTPRTRPHGVIATPHRAATDAGRAAYESGGNALDAALAAAAVLAVVYPHNTGIGGDLVAIIQAPDRAVTGINATGWSARKTDIQALAERHGDELPIRGVDTVTVPGAVRGWEAVAASGARLTRQAHLSAAIEAAENGAPVAASLALCAASEWDRLTDDSFRAVFGHRGGAPERGAILRQEALASSLRMIARDGADAFYEGGLTPSLLRLLGDRGSAIGADDFADYRVDDTEPIAMPWREYRVRTLGPNTQGFALLRTAAAVESISGPVDAAALARLFRDGNTLRDTALGDPRLHRIDIDALIHGWLADVPPVRVGDPRLARGDTIGIAASDEDGWSVSLVQSLFHLFGSGVFDPETGVLFQNRGSSFSLDPESTNAYLPRSRPAHTLMPVIVTDVDDRMRFVQASMGGKAQAQIHAHLLLHLAAGASAAEAVRAPRWTVGPYAPGDRSDAIYAEADVPDQTIAELRSTGAPLRTVPPLTEMLGHANVIRATDSGLDAAADPRSDGSGRSPWMSDHDLED